MKRLDGSKGPRTVTPDPDMEVPPELVPAVVDFWCAYWDALERGQR